MRIPFDIKYKPQIESGEYKVETREGLPVRIICWDRLSKKHQDAGLNLCVLVPDDDGEAVYYYDRSGKRWVPNDDFDLFIVTPEEEMTEFEKKLWEVLKSEGSPIGPIEKFTNADKEVFHSYAADLLSLARDQFIEDGYILEKKAFHDAVEKVSPEVMKEVSDNVDMEEALRLEYEKGRAEALKDLPRWREWGNGAAGNSDGHPIALVSGAGGIRFVSVLGVTGEKYIMLDDLKKLTGFKED